MAVQTQTSMVDYGLIIGVVLADQLSKWWATRQGWVTLNQGVSFGWGADSRLVIGLVGVFLLSLWWWRSSIPFGVWGLLLGGAISNILDRGWMGGVRDWLPVPWLGLNNNLADWAIFIALVWWLWLMSRRRSTNY